MKPHHGAPGTDGIVERVVGAGSIAAGFTPSNRPRALSTTATAISRCSHPESSPYSGPHVHPAGDVRAPRRGAHWGFATANAKHSGAASMMLGPGKVTIMASVRP